MVGSGDHHVIALHGWFGSALGWGHLPDYLNTTEFSYVFPDLRGYGSRRDEPGEFTMAEAAADAITLADQLGWERFSVIGHSMSGVAIQHVLDQARPRVRRLIGVAPVPAGGLPLGESEWSLFASAAASPASRAMIVNYATGNRLAPAFIDQIVTHSLENSSETAFGAYLESWARAERLRPALLDRVKGIDVPVKVITGEYDPTQPAEFMEQAWLQVYPNTEIDVLRASGNYPMFETPITLSVAIEEFLARG
jgi:pimeloyl-ACP methyl ester carboxylesterase